MSYCVNCGVHLDDRAKSCPLCAVKVFNPIPQIEDLSLSDSQLKEEEYDESFDKNLWIKIVSILLVFPAIISLLVNWIFQKQLSWSLYVAASLGLAWIWSLSPFLFHTKILVKWIPIGATSLLGFFYAVEVISGKGKWFFSLALPITLSFFLLLALLTILIRRNILKELQIPAAILLSIGFFCVCVNSAVNHFLGKTLQPDWSLIVLTTCAAFASIAFVLQQRPWIVGELKQWFRM